MTAPKRQPKLIRVWYAVATMFLGVLLALILVFVLIAQLRSDSQDATCDVVETQERSVAAQLAAYRETPPTTEIGRNSEQAAKDSQQAWKRLAQSLHC